MSFTRTITTFSKANVAYYKVAVIITTISVILAEKWIKAPVCTVINLTHRQQCSEGSREDRAERLTIEEISREGKREYVK